MKMENNLISISNELVNDIKSLEGFSSNLIEEELVHSLASKLDELTKESKEERINAYAICLH